MTPRTPPHPGRLAAAAFLLLGTLPVLAAQETEPPPPDLTTGVKLVFKFTPGQVQRFRLGTTMDLTLTPEGGGGGIGPIPLTGKMMLGYTEKVAGTREGTATIAWRLDAMTTSYNALGTNLVMKLQNGKVVTTTNGRPAPPQAAQGAAALQAVANKPVMMRRTAQGEMTPVSGGSTGLEQIPGGPALSVAFLPSMPVQVGESWETVQKVRPSVPTGAGAGVQMSVPEIEIRLTHTLTSLDTKNGKLFALIETIGSGSTPEGGAVTVNQNFNGTTRFDVKRGAMVSGKYTLDMGMQVPVAALGAPGGGAGAPQGAPQSVRIDGAMEMSVREVPPAPAKPAAGRPSAKARPRRR